MLLAVIFTVVIVGVTAFAAIVFAVHGRGQRPELPPRADEW